MRIFLYKDCWLFLSGASISSSPSHHYLSIGKRSDTLNSTQKRVSDRPTHQRRQDCCAVHESACIGSDHLRPAATLVGERAIDVGEQQLSVCAKEIYKYRRLDTWSLHCRPLSFRLSSSSVGLSDRTARACEPSRPSQLHLRPTISRRFGDARFRHKPYRSHNHHVFLNTTLLPSGLRATQPPPWRNSTPWTSSS